jgi:excinuclease ABC subunit A
MVETMNDRFSLQLDAGLKNYVTVLGARTHNLKNVDLTIPRDALVVFTGISGSGKSSLAFGTLYAEAQRRYLESVSPYARRLFDQMEVPEVDEIQGLPPAVALQQQRGSPSTRSSVGSVTTLSNLLRMLYSRAGHYPARQPHLEAEAFSPNTPAGACPGCHGLGRVYDVTEKALVPDPSRTIRERAVAAWPPAWHGQNLRDMLVSLGHDIDRPWNKLSKKARDWILFTDEQPRVPVYIGYNPDEVRRAVRRKEEPSYMGTFSSARRFVLDTFATTQSAMIKKRVQRYLGSIECSVCHGKRLRRESLSVTFSDHDIAELGKLTIRDLSRLFEPYANGTALNSKAMAASHPEKLITTQRIAQDVMARLAVVADLGLSYLSLDRTTPTLSPGELQRLRLATQVRSNLFGVVYVLDEPSAGLHPADTEALIRALDQLKSSGNSIFVVEHELDVIRHADWIVDVGPEAGEQGGRVLYSGRPEGLRNVEGSHTRKYLFAENVKHARLPRQPIDFLRLSGITRNNLQGIDASFPLRAFTSVTGISGSGKSSLIGQALVELVAAYLGQDTASQEEVEDLERPDDAPTGGRIVDGMDGIKRLVVVDQKPIGRTPRSTLATYTGLFDRVRKLFAATKSARLRNFDAGQFSFNVSKGRCATCEGEGWVMVELLFLPSVFAPCPTCHGDRFNKETLKVRYREKNVADVLRLTVDEAETFFKHDGPIRHSLAVLQGVGLGYLRLGQAATELSGGEAQRIKLATELQRIEHGDTLYILDEPTTGLHPADVDKLLAQLQGLVDAGNTVIVVEHDMHVVADGDWVIDIGPGAGDEGGRIVAVGPPLAVSRRSESRTAAYLASYLER